MEVTKVWFENDRIFIRTKKGREQSMPLAWFPRLYEATVKERENFTLSSFGIHWESLDEDLSFEGFFKFKKERIRV